jgi:hypothetical protein
MKVFFIRLGIEIIPWRLRHVVKPRNTNKPVLNYLENIKCPMNSIYVILLIFLCGVIFLFLIVALEVLTYGLGEDHWFTKWFRKHIISHDDLEPMD